MKLTIFHDEEEFKSVSFDKFDDISQSRETDHILILNQHHAILLHLKNKKLMDTMDFEKFKLMELINHNCYFVPIQYLDELLGTGNDY